MRPDYVALTRETSKERERKAPANMAPRLYTNPFSGLTVIETPSTGASRVQWRCSSRYFLGPLLRKAKFGRDDGDAEVFSF